MMDVDVDKPRRRFVKDEVHWPDMALDVPCNGADELGVAGRMDWLFPTVVSFRYPFRDDFGDPKTSLSS